MIKPHNIEEHANSLAHYLPGGRTFEAKNIDGSNLRQLLRGLAKEMQRAEAYLISMDVGYLSDTNPLYVAEWERAVGIPDDCFDTSGTLAQRWANVKTKLASLGIQTVDDFIRLAAIFGKVINVRPLSSELYPPYSVPFYPVTKAGSRYTLIIEGVDVVSSVPPYDVPFDVLGGEDILQCLFDRLKPDNVVVILRNTN